MFISWNLLGQLTDLEYDLLFSFLGVLSDAFTATILTLGK